MFVVGTSVIVGILLLFATTKWGFDGNSSFLCEYSRYHLSGVDCFCRCRYSSILLMCAGSTMVGNFSLEITFFIFNATAKVAHRKLQKNTNNSINNNGLHSLKVQSGLVQAVHWLLIIIIFASAVVVDYIHI